MKHRNNLFTATFVVFAFALAPISQAAPSPDGGPSQLRSNEAPSPDGGPVGLLSNQRVNANSDAIPEEENLPTITIHCTDNVKRGKTGSFVLEMKPALMLGGMHVKFSVSGSAIPGADYVALVSPAYIGQAGYAVIQVETLNDPRGSSIRQAYSVVVTLENGAGYSVGQPSSATMWIKP